MSSRSPDSTINMGEQANASSSRQRAISQAIICIRSGPHISLHLLGHHCAHMSTSIPLLCTMVSKKTCINLWAGLNAYGCLEETKLDQVRVESTLCRMLNGFGERRFMEIRL
ncbi:TPA: hypothetical protein ACH3X2_009822 [Trebouxia sp. C0005]